MSSVSNFLVNLMSAGDCTEQTPDIKRTKWITNELLNIGCKCDFQIFDDTANVLAILGNEKAKKKICFCGHCDVVPAKNWNKNPHGEIINNKVYGRGAVDMLGAIACWFSAIKKIDKSKLNNVCIATLLTGDEEGDGTNGTKKMIEYLKQKKITFNDCIVGEPTNDYFIKNKNKDIDNELFNAICSSRGGSFNFKINVYGKSGHVAYVGEFENPITKAVNLCNALKNIHFNDKTNLEIVSFDGKNNTSNVILNNVILCGNIRFHDLSYDEIYNKLKKTCIDILEQQDNFKLDVSCNRFGYKTDTNSDFCQLVLKCLKRHNQEAIFTIVKGVTDGEYMKQICDNVCEFGLKCKTMHQIDEYTTIQDLETLTNIYQDIINEYITSQC